MQRLIIFSVLILLFQCTFAETHFSCHPVKVKIQNKNIILIGSEKNEAGQVYFFKNAGKEAIWLDHPTRKSMSAGWSTYLRPANWSAFLLNRKDFLLTCSAIRPGKVDTLDCIKVLSICAPKEFTFKTPPKGTYWLVEDKPWDELIKVMEKRGVSIK